MTMRTPSPEWLRKLAPYVPGKPIEELERELGIRDSIKLASNENPLGPSPKAMEAVAAALTKTHLYPDASAFALRARLGTFLDVDPGRIVVGNGSNELLTMLVRAFATPADNAVVSEFAFVAYKVVLGAAGVPVRTVPSVNLGHDLAAMAAACDASTRLLFVANPNNPTGTYNPRAELETLLRTVPEHVMVVLDEAYVEYADAGDYASALALTGLRENLVVVRTFSKAYGLAGFRVGYAVGPTWVAELLNRMREPFNVGLLSQVAAMAALDDTEFVARTVATNRATRATLYAGLERLGVPYVASLGNFVLARPPMSGRALYDRLLRRGVIVRPVDPYGLPEWIRISVGLPSENARFLRSLAEELGRPDALEGLSLDGETTVAG